MQKTIQKGECMIKCDRCTEWYHGDCIDYICDACTILQEQKEDTKDDKTKIKKLINDKKLLSDKNKELEKELEKCKEIDNTVRDEAAQNKDKIKLKNSKIKDLGDEVKKLKKEAEKCKKDVENLHKDRDKKERIMLTERQKHIKKEEEMTAKLKEEEEAHKKVIDAMEKEYESMETKLKKGLENKSKEIKLHIKKIQGLTEETFKLSKQVQIAGHSMTREKEICMVDVMTGIDEDTLLKEGSELYMNDNEVLRKKLNEMEEKQKQSEEKGHNEMKNKIKEHTRETSKLKEEIKQYEERLEMVLEDSSLKEKTMNNLNDQLITIKSINKSIEINKARMTHGDIIQSSDKSQLEQNGEKRFEGNINEIGDDKQSNLKSINRHEEDDQEGTSEEIEESRDIITLPSSGLENEVSK